MSVRAALVLLLSASAALGIPPRGELRLHGLFGDGMVLQRDAPCPVWGSADPGTEVAVAFAGRRKAATAGADGRWMVRLDPTPAGGPYELTVEGPARLVVRDVLVGDVWLATGGSKMEAPLKSSQARATVSDEQLERLRLFRVAPREEDEPARDARGGWASRDARAAADFSAVAYLFGLEILEKQRVPVGLIQATAPDAPPELWISPAGLAKSPAARTVLMNHRRALENFASATTLHYYAVRKARERGRDPDAIPPPPRPGAPCRLYNGMIAPLAPYALRGAIAHPSESHVQDAGLLGATIEAWREEWGRGDFPFGFVQLGRLGTRAAAPENSDWAEFRVQQERTAALPKVGMVVSLDVGDPADERPRTALDVAQRLALWAQAAAYGRDLVWSGPVFESLKSEGDRLRLRFRNAGGGLVAGGGGLAGFAVADDFMEYAWAEARIEDDSVVVWNEKMKFPTHVRYAWGDNPRGTLYNREGLPAHPFRTDDWGAPRRPGPRRPVPPAPADR